MKLINELKEIVSNEKFGYDQEQIMLKTGFDTFDYLNGFVSVDDKGNKKYNIGVDAGRIITVIGKTGTGKSTLGLQIGANLIRNYENGMMVVLDFEQAASKERIRMVTGVSEEEYENKFTIKKTGIYTETVYELIKQIRDFKTDKKNMKNLLVDNVDGVKNEAGEIMQILPPTVILVDSVANMIPRDTFEVDTLKGGMDATAMAKANTQLFKRIGQYCTEANIIPIFINHITDDIATGVMPKAASVNYGIRQGESIPGGRAPVYLTNTLIRITAGTKYEEDKPGGFKIKGFEAKVELGKSRTAPAGRSVSMVFNQMEGFDNIFSAFMHLKNEGLVQGTQWMTLSGLDTKFKITTLKEILGTDETFKTHFWSLVKTSLNNSIKESSNYQSHTDSILEDIVELVGDEEEQE